MPLDFGELASTELAEVSRAAAALSRQDSESSSAGRILSRAERAIAKARIPGPASILAHQRAGKSTIMPSGSIASGIPTSKEQAMVHHSRREFLGDVGRGMLLAGLGTTLSADLGLAWVRADEKAASLSFGALEPLVALMQDTLPAKLTAILVDQLKSGTIVANAGGRRGTCQRPNFRRTGLHRLSHVHGAGPRVPHGPRTARGPAAPARIESPLSKCQPDPGIWWSQKRGAAPGRRPTPSRRALSPANTCVT